MTGDGDEGRYLLEKGAELEDEDHRRAYLAQVEEGDRHADDATFEYLKQNWDRLEPEERARVTDNLERSQRKELEHEYGTLQGTSDLREYDPDNAGMNEDAFESAYQDWDRMDTDERRQRWQRMNGAQKRRIRDEYANTVDESTEDWMIDPEDWEQRSSEEKERLWYQGGLDRKERRTIADSDAYTLDIEMDPSRYEDEGWHSITKPEKLAVIESDEYTVEDFGKRDYRPRTPGGSLLGLMTGTGTGSVAAPFTFQMMTSGSSEMAATGAGIQLAAGLGGYAAGSLADEASRDTSRRHAFGDRELEQAYQQRQQSEEDPAEDGTERDWDYVSRVRDSLLGSDDARSPDQTDT